MNRDIDLHNTEVISTGTLPKTGGAYALVLLDGRHISQMVVLEQAAYDDLPAMRKAFMVPHRRADFEQHFAEKHVALGLVHDGKLAAQSLLALPSLEHPSNHLRDMVIEVAPERLAVLEGMRVYPGYIGNNIQTLMIDARLEIANRGMRTDVISEVATENHYSWRNLLQEGLDLHSIGTDGADGTRLYNFHAKVLPLIQRRLTPDFGKAARKASVLTPRTDLAAQQQLLSEGYKGVSYDKASESIGFEARITPAPGSHAIAAVPFGYGTRTGS